MMSRFAAIVTFALTSVQVQSFSSAPFALSHGVSRSHRLPTNPLGMASSSSRADYDYNEDLPENDDNLNMDRRHNSIQSETQGHGGKFITGDNLHRLRHKVLAMRLELQEARRNGDERLVYELERSILGAQQADAEFVYTVSLEKMEQAESEGRFAEAARLKSEAFEARRALPQFNLDGLWVGKYGDHAGYEMINVTYVGDTLVARKITGTKNVPKGEATFEVDLSPRTVSGEGALEPIELGDQAASQWGSRYLQRFAGTGQVAAEGYQDSQWIDGQLILVNDYFSFAWLPIGHQVFFGRPTAELVLKLLKEDVVSGERPSERAFLEKCWEETEHIEDDIEVSNDGLFNPVDQPHTDYNQEGCFE